MPGYNGRKELLVVGLHILIHREELNKMNRGTDDSLFIKSLVKLKAFQNH